MAVYSMLTDVGLSEINNAQPGSIYLEVAYWVAAFDQELDDDYNGLNGPTGEARARDISNYTTPSDQYPTNPTNPSGVTRYWNTLPAGTDPSSLVDPDTEYLYPGVSFQPVVETEATNFRGTWDGSSGVFPQDPANGDYWVVNPAGTLYETPGASSGIYFGADDDLVYNGVTFKNGVEPNRRGNFKIIVEDASKVMEINKIALYGIRRSEDGTIQTDPFLLGQVIIPKAQLIQPRESTDSFSVDQLVVDFQIDTQAVLTNFDDIIFSSQKDYWSRVVDNDSQYGLQYDGQVYITNRLGTEDQSGSFPVGADAGVAKLMVSTYESVNKPNPSEEKDMPQLVLQYVKSNVFPANNDNAFSPRIRTTMRTTQDGNCEFDLYGSCDNEFGYYALTPQEDRTFGLGNNDNRWRLLKTSNWMELYLGENYVTETVEVENVSGRSMPTGTNIEIVDVDSTSIKVAIATVGSDSVGQTAENIPNGRRGDALIRKDAVWDYIKSSDVGRYHPSQEYGFIVMRDNAFGRNKNLGIGYFGNSSIEVGPHYDSRDYIDGVLPIKENYFYTYGNISNYIPGIKRLDGDFKYNVDFPLNVRSTNHISLYTLSWDSVSPYEKDGIHASDWNADANAVTDEIVNLIRTGGDRLSKSEDAFFKGIKGSTEGATILDNLFLNSKWEENKGDIGDRDSLRTQMFGSTSPSGDPETKGNSIGTDIMLTSSRFIYTFGDIVPMVDGINNIGTSKHAYNRMYVAELWGTGSTYDETYPILSVRGDIYPSTTGTKIGRDNRFPDNTGPRWRQMNADMIGNNGDWVDNGYIKNIRANRMDFDETSDGDRGHLQFNGNGHIGFGSNGTYINNDEIVTSNIICDNITVKGHTSTSTIFVDKQYTEYFNDVIAVGYNGEGVLAEGSSNGHGVAVEVNARKDTLTGNVDISFRVLGWGNSGSDGCPGSINNGRQIVYGGDSSKTNDTTVYFPYSIILDVIDVDYIDNSVELLGSTGSMGGRVFGAGTFGPFESGAGSESCYKYFPTTIGYENTRISVNMRFDEDAGGRSGCIYTRNSNMALYKVNSSKWYGLTYQPKR